MYRYELKGINIVNLELLSSTLSKFISNALTVIRDNNKFNINEFKIIFDNDLGNIYVYSVKDFEELIHRFPSSSAGTEYSKVDDDDDKYFMPMNAKYDLHLLNLSSARLISKIIQDFIHSIQLYSSMFMYPVRIIVDLTESVVSMQMYDDFKEVIDRFDNSNLQYTYTYNPDGLEEE